MVGLGLLVGLAGALAGVRLIGSLLYNLSAYDPVTIGGITLVLALRRLLRLLAAGPPRDEGRSDRRGSGRE